MFGGGFMYLVLITPFPNVPAKVRASGGNYRVWGSAFEPRKVYAPSHGSIGNDPYR
jgi:hypothetical protein